MIVTPLVKGELYYSYQPQGQRQKLSHLWGNNTSKSHVHFRIGRVASEYLTYFSYFL